MSNGEGLCLWIIVWLLALIIYGLAGTSDMNSMSDLTAEVDRLAVVEGRQ